MNPAMLLPTLASDSESKEFGDDCVAVTELCTKARADILVVPLKLANLTLFVDRSFQRPLWTLKRNICSLHHIWYCGSILFEQCNLSTRS